MMNRLTSIVLIGGLLLIGACHNKQSNRMDTANSAKDSIMAISDSLIEQDRIIKEHYRQITNPLEEIIYGKNSFDYVPIDSKTFAWHKKCKTALVKVYDSSNPKSGLSDNAKVDSLFNDLETYYDLNGEEIDYSKYFGLSIQRIKKSLILYHIAEKTIALIQRDSSFINEQKAWERMQMALEKYYLTAEEILYTGGSGSDVLCLMAMNDIYRNRDNDLQRMLKNNCVDANNIQVARGKFILSVDSIGKYIKEEFTEEEWKTWRDIPQLIDKMHKARKPLIIALDDWISERKRYDGCANAIIDLNHTISDVR